jgi:prolipoprotein diacylglyceryltransferase
MAFFGAIFLIMPVLCWRAIKERLNPLAVLDAGALFAACAQPFGRLGKLINGDIIGYPSTLPGPRSMTAPRVGPVRTLPLAPATCRCNLLLAMNCSSTSS